MEITKDSIIQDILDKYPQTAEIFHRFGMQCVGCPSAIGESLEEAANGHGVETKQLLSLLQSSLQ